MRVPLVYESDFCARLGAKMKPAASADRYASEVVRDLMAMRWSRTSAIAAVQTEEKYLRQQHAKGTPPAFAASVVARRAKREGAKEIVGLARGSSALRSSGVGLASGTLGVGTGQRSSSGGKCAPFLPPLWVSPEIGEALEKASAATASSGAGHAFGRKGQTKAAKATKAKSGGVLSGIVVSKAGTSWTKGGAKYVSSSTNSKIGAVDTTWASIASTCVDCSFKEAKVCYALGGNAKYTVAILDRAAVHDDATQVALDEAACINAAYNGGNVPAGRILRVHSSGDTSTPVGARAMATAIAGWYRRGGELAYTYTHAWRRVKRGDFGRLHVLASLNPGDDAREALAMGYKSVTALAPIDVWASRMVLTSNGQLTFKQVKDPIGDNGAGLTFIPCLAQYPIDEGASGREAFRWKMGYLANKIGIAPGDIEAFVKRLNTGIEFIEDEDSAQHGWPITEGHKGFAKIADAVVAAGLPTPTSNAFRQMFRALPKSEKTTCDKCALCHDDGNLGSKGKAVLFRGDFSGGIVKTESLLRKQAERRIAEAAE